MEILTPILKTFLSFTAKIEGQNQVKLSIQEIAMMIGKINIIIDKLDLDDDQISIIVKILKNIFDSNPYSAAFYLIIDTKITTYFLEIIENWKTEDLKIETLN